MLIGLSAKTESEHFLYEVQMLTVLYWRSQKGNSSLTASFM
jgi:hypothetical protein